jgi:glycosyltransferase involved in cell wall biosynthesis
VIDARTVGPVPHGFARYVTRLAEGLAQLRDSRGLDYEPVFIVGKDCSQPIFSRFRTRLARVPIHRPGELVEIPALLKLEGAGLYHSPTFSSLAWCPCPWIVTVHDLNHLTYGDLGKKIYYEALLKRFARKASALLTVSRFSRGELAAWLDVNPDSIEVVFNALDPALLMQASSASTRAVLEKYGLERGRYFLSLSNSKPHKNLGTLLKAFRLRQGSSASVRWPLVLTLKGYESLPGLVQTGALSDEDSRILLANCGALLFPSLYEGFGLPPLEALASGVPAAISDIAPHREAIGELPEPLRKAIRWVDPRLEGEWARTMDEIADTAEAGAPASVRKEDRSAVLACYSSERLATHMDRIYRRVLGLTP